MVMRSIDVGKMAQEIRLLEYMTTITVKMNKRIIKRNKILK